MEIDYSRLIDTEYVFLFLGGTGGSCVKGIFNYYLHILFPSKYRPIRFNINPITGDCHDINFDYKISHYHEINELVITKKIILIDFDDDDKKTIAKMVFYKIFWPQVCQDPNTIKTWANGSLSHMDLLDFDLFKKILIENQDYIGLDPQWKNRQLTAITPVLTIKFKDIFFGNVNQIIANFFQTTQLPEVDTFINEYRTINKKYIDFT